MSCKPLVWLPKLNGASQPTSNEVHHEQRVLPQMCLGLILVVLALSLAGTALGQTTKADDGVLDSNGGVRQSRVIIDGEALFSVRGVTAYPAERRAREIAARIRNLAANRSFAPASLTVEEHPSGS